MAEDKLEMAERLKFDYIKGDCFRVVHVDGVHGGLAPSPNQLALSFFSERRPIPQHEEYDVKDGRLVRDDGATVVRGCDVIREVEMCAIMNMATATALHKWLGEKLAEYKQVMSAVRAMRAGDSPGEVANG
jgi:hypothetical protein